MDVRGVCGVDLTLLLGVDKNFDRNEDRVVDLMAEVAAAVMGVTGLAADGCLWCAEVALGILAAVEEEGADVLGERDGLDCEVESASM